MCTFIFAYIAAKCPKCRGIDIPLFCLPYCTYDRVSDVYEEPLYPLFNIGSLDFFKKNLTFALLAFCERNPWAAIDGFPIQRSVIRKALPCRNFTVMACAIA